MGFFGKIDGSNLKLLHQLGFYCWEDAEKCDWAQNDSIKIESQTNESTTDPEKYREAFNVLAGLTWMKNAIDDDDIEALSDPKKLAMVILEDPMMPRIIYSGDALECGKGESAGKIYSRHFMRLLTYIQM